MFILDIQVEHIIQGKHGKLSKWLREHVQHADSELAAGTRELGNHSIHEMLSHFKSQQDHHSSPLPHQTKAPVQHKIESIMTLKATHNLQEHILKELIEEGEGLGEVVDSATNLAQIEWQESVDILCTSIKQLWARIMEGCQELNARDESRAELLKVEKDKWTNGFMNLHVLRDQLLRKLCAWKAELSQLDHQQGQWEADQSLHSQVEKAVKSQASGIESTLKKYNEKLKQLASLHGKNGVPPNAWLPSELQKEGLYTLDVNQDIWLDYDALDFDKLPVWLTDPAVKEGIPSVQAVISCCSEKQQCHAEWQNICQWIHAEINIYCALHNITLPADKDVAFFTLMRLHELSTLLGPWKAASAGLMELLWPDFMPPSSKEAGPHFVGGCVVPETSSSNNDDSACVSSDDDEDGPLEEEIDSESILCDLEDCLD